MPNKHKVVFLDRDGTLIHDRPGHYLSHPDKLRFYRSTFQALELLQAHGFKLVVLSNQSGLATGILTQNTLDLIHQRLQKSLRQKGIRLTAIFYCPHAPEDHCRCRKPKTFLARQALRQCNLTLNGSFVIGDKKADIDLGRRLKIRPIFVKTGHGKSQMKKYAKQLKPAYTADHILRAAQWIIHH